MSVEVLFFRWATCLVSRGLRRRVLLYRMDLDPHIKVLPRLTSLHLLVLVLVRCLTGILVPPLVVSVPLLLMSSSA